MRLTFLWLMLFISSGTIAQTIDYNRVITPETYRGSNTIEEKLVRLAWANNPAGEISRIHAEIAEKNVGLARWSWMGNIRGVYNINDMTMNTDPAPNDPNNSQRLLPFPRYNIGIGISLGDIVTTPTKISVAKSEMKLAEQEINAQKLQTRAVVLEQYYNYQLAAQLLQIRSEENEEAYANFTLASDKFKTGEATLDEYNKTATIYHTARAALVQQEIQLKIEKARLEAYIGVKLESVLE